MPSELARSAGRRLARLATNLAVRSPRLWPVVRPLIRYQFDWLAPYWDQLREPGYLDAFERGLAELEEPQSVLDLGTGTGLGAFTLAARFPHARVTGVDLAADMVAEARRKTPADVADRVRFQVADAAQLPFPDGSFDLATLNNMIPFFDELARVLAPGGTVLIAFSFGAGTPIYVPLERIREELRARGFSQFAEITAGSGTGLLARKGRAD